MFLRATPSESDADRKGQGADDMTEHALDPADDEETPLKVSPGTALERKRFHEHDSGALAKAAGVKAGRHNAPTEKFAYFRDDSRFVVVAGAQEGHDVGRALAKGLGLRGDRRLILVLPDEHCFATMQRAAWLDRQAQPEIWAYGKGNPVKQKLPKRDQTLQALRERAKGQEPEDELLASTTAKHLGPLSRPVSELVEWASSHLQLDGSHLKGERAWHCMGQKVLSIKGSKTSAVIRAGVHYSGPKAPEPEVVTSVDQLTADRLKKVRVAVGEGIAQRLEGDDLQIHRPDEHWLQAVIRRDPKLVGVEQPALREFPAWRPRDDGKRWGRGFIDLMGLDGHGNVRVVETKVAKNADEMLILQGLDYYIWAQVYGDAVRRRLSASRSARFEIHYVIGDSDGAVHVAPHAPAQVMALADSIPWRSQTVVGWYRQPDATPRATSTLLGVGQLPPPKGKLT